MPQLTPEQEDAIFGMISKQLFRINNLVKGMFGQEMTDDELRAAHAKVQQGVNQAIQAMQQPDSVVNPNEMTSADAGPRDLLLRSLMPIPKAMGPVVNPLDATGNGFSPMTGLLSDQSALQALRGPQGQGT